GGGERAGKESLEVPGGVQRAQEVPAGGRVPEEKVVIRSAGDSSLGELLEAREELELLEPGRDLDQVAIDLTVQDGVGDPLRGEVRAHDVGEQVSGVDMDDVEVPGGAGELRGEAFERQRDGQLVKRVRADDDDLPAAFGGAQGEREAQGRLADSAFAAEDDDFGHWWGRLIACPAQSAAGATDAISIRRSSKL